MFKVVAAEEALLYLRKKTHEDRGPVKGRSKEQVSEDRKGRQFQPYARKSKLALGFDFGFRA